MMRRLYSQLDHALEQWKETLQEVQRVGGKFWEVEQFQRIPGVGPIAAHVFSAIIEEPSRFPSKFKLWKYSQLGITDRSSDNKPLGYQRLDRRGNAELKKPLLSRLAHGLQIHHRPKCDQELLAAKPLTHRKCASCAAQHPAQDPRSALADLVATPAL
jgi:transposase